MNKITINRSLFSETSHSPALIDIVPADQLHEVADFCFIANPYYPTRNMVRELIRKFPEAIKAYPSSNPRLAQEHLAAVLNIKPEHLILGNGATELITIICQELTDHLAVPIPTFSEYLEKLPHPEAAKLYQLPADQEYKLHLVQFGRWMDDHQFKAALIINPGNPTGQLIPRTEMLDFLNQMAHLKLIVVDESFLDFSGDPQESLMNELERFPNLVIIRSMSKHCGVPGLRLGYCCTANECFTSKIRNRLPVWNLNTMAELFLGQLTETDQAYQSSVRRIVRDVQYLYRQLKQLRGYLVYPTGSNFMMLKIDNGLTAQEIQYRLLEDYGVYVRDCSNKIGLDNLHIRVASQGRKKDQRLIDALREIQQQVEKATETQP